MSTILLPELIRVEVHVSGIVQGVGFRPFVYGLAHKHSLRGCVFNNESGVLIDVEGPRESIDQFISELKSHPPSLARIESVRCSDDLEHAYYSDFQIVESAGNGRRFVPISPDVATCADCLRELLDPHDRRFRYPFINCTNCGPRFTIIEDVPYDRACSRHSATTFLNWIFPSSKPWTETNGRRCDRWPMPV